MESALALAGRIICWPALFVMSVRESDMCSTTTAELNRPGSSRSFAVSWTPPSQQVCRRRGLPARWPAAAGHLREPALGPHRAGRVTSRWRRGREQRRRHTATGGRGAGTIHGLLAGGPDRPKRVRGVHLQRDRREATAAALHIAARNVGCRRRFTWRGCKIVARDVRQGRSDGGQRGATGHGTPYPGYFTSLDLNHFMTTQRRRGGCGLRDRLPATEAQWQRRPAQAFGSTAESNFCASVRHSSARGAQSWAGSGKERALAMVDPGPDGFRPSIGLPYWVGSAARQP